VNVLIPASSTDQINTGEILANSSGEAREFVIAVLAHAAELVSGASFSLSNGSTFGQPATLAAALNALRTTVGSADDRYFGWLASMNVEWIGISVPIHYDSFSDPRALSRIDADRVFDWAASVLPGFFSGATSTGTLGPFYYRFHAGTETYLGLQEATGDVYVHNGREFNLMDVGPLRTYLDQAGRAGF
jgi:hypothetical protein